MRPETAHLLLDTPAMTRLFSRMPALQRRTISAGELAALWVKPGRHFNACYRLNSSDARGETVLASAYVLEPPRAAQIVSNIGPHGGDADNSTCAHCCTVLVQPDLLLQLFPFDYRLPMLPACLDADGIARALDSGLRFTGCEPIGYRPGMRCQIRYRTAAGTSVFGKTAVERTPAQTFELHHRVHAALCRTPQRFQVPQPLRYIPALHLALMAEAPGESLHDLLRTDGNLDTEIRMVAAALADFHRLGINGIERVYAVRDDTDLLEGWVSLVGELFPRLAGALNESYSELVRTQPNSGDIQVFVHRDFYDKQVLLSPHGLTFLDMDTACKGDAEIDLGNFCAQLRLRGLQFGLQAKCAHWERTFLAAYPASVAPEKVAWYRRSSLLRLACGYALRPNWQHLAPALLEQVRP